MKPSTTAADLRRPAISARFYDPSPWGTAALCVYAASLYFVPALTAVYLWRTVPNPLVSAVLMAPLLILSGYGIQLMVSVGHDGTHLSLSRSNLLSAVIGIVYASVAFSYFEMGFALQHWEHHRFTNQASDPDIQTLRRLRTPWQRLLLTRIFFNYGYVKTVLGLMFGMPYRTKYHLPFTLREIRALCWFNFLCAAAWLTFFVWVLVSNPVTGTILVLLPSLVADLVSGAEGYMNHAGRDVGPFWDSRSRISPLWTVVLAGANYHLEHHLYPGVPCYRLPRVRRLLLENGVYARAEASRAEPSFLGAYLNNLGSEYTVKGDDAADDPLLHAVTPDPYHATPRPTEARAGA